jgi:UDP-N-acetylglucosamine:LPS N-acetylglucosamine transferase
MMVGALVNNGVYTQHQMDRLLEKISRAENIIWDDSSSYLPAFYAADAIITKPGGLTTSEALAKRLPMIIINPIPGQEDRNTEFLLNQGAAMAVTETFPLDEAIWQLLSSPRRIALMREAIEQIRRPNATRDICAFIRDLGDRNTDFPTIPQKSN